MDIELAKKMYKEGMSVIEIAEEFGVTRHVIHSKFYELGFKTNNGNSSSKDSVFKEDILKLYNNGYSVLKISKTIKKSRGFIHRVLCENSITPRNRSESMHNRMASLTFEEKQKLTMKANETVRLHGLPEESNIKIAKTKESLDCFIGEGEELYNSWLNELSFQTFPQKAIGNYNIDIFSENIAVEIHSNTRHPHNFEKDLKRIEFLLSKGYSVLYIKIYKTKNGKYVTTLNRKSVDSFIELRKELTPTYYCIYGDGKKITKGKLTNNKLHLL